MNDHTNINEDEELYALKLRKNWEHGYYPHRDPYVCTRCEATVKEKRQHTIEECFDEVCRRLRKVEDRLDSHNL